MKALVYTGTRTLEYREEAEPVPGDGDVLVQVQASGICGSDMHAWHGHDERRQPPLILGHEAAGVVLDGDLAGRRVALNPLMTCGTCRACLGGRQNLCKQRDILGMRRAGAFAERVSIAKRNLYLMPDDLDMVTASLMEPAAVSLHGIVMAQRQLSRPLDECSVLVIGGGAIGLLAALFLAHKQTGAVAVAETSAGRRASVVATGCAEVLDPIDEAHSPWLSASSAELVIDAVGSAATRRMASHCVAPGGVICHIGLQDNEGGLDTRKLTLQEVSFFGTYTYTPVDLGAALDALHGGHLGTLDWVERRSMAEGARAFEDIDRQATLAPKIVLLPDP